MWSWVGLDLRLKASAQDPEGLRLGQLEATDRFSVPFRATHSVATVETKLCERPAPLRAENRPGGDAPLWYSRFIAVAMCLGLTEAVASGGVPEALIE